MFVDSRKFNKKQHIDSDLCIIGSGPAGITIANEFLEKNISVTLLESGGIDGETSNQDLNQGDIVGQDPGYDLEMSRLRLFGGTSNHWVGSNQMLDPIDFKYREWIKYSGWPITIDDLKPFYKKAFEINEIPNLFEDLPYFDKKDTFLKYSLLLQKKLKEDIYFLTNYINPLRFSDKYIESFKDNDNLNIIVHCTATNISTNGNNIEKIEAVTSNYEKVTVKSKFYVLAMGGIENARFLLLNIDNIPFKNINNQPIIGSFFQEHYGATAGTLIFHEEITKYLTYMNEYNFKNKLETETYFIPSENTQKDQRILNSRITFYNKNWNSILGPDDINFRNNYKETLNAISGLLKSMEGPLEWYKSFKNKDAIFNRPQRIFIGFEQAPNPNSKVYLNNKYDKLGQRQASLNWKLNETDELSINKVTTWLSEIVGVYGLGRINIGPDIKNIEWTKNNSPIAGGYHHMGTTRMGSNVNESVVDKDCKYHQLNNLYLAGSSVFSTGGSTNPTLTIVALALRLAEHLKKRLS